MTSRKANREKCAEENREGRKEREDEEMTPRRTQRRELKPRRREEGGNKTATDATDATDATRKKHSSKKPRFSQPTSFNTRSGLSPSAG